MRASYTLSRSYLDGVDFFVTTRGTQRTPHERGYNPSDQRHNLTLAGTLSLPWAIELSGIGKLISGSPIKVQAGFDLDGDGILDLVIGAESGETLVLRKLGGGVDRFERAGALQLPGIAAPAFADVDGDGDADLLVGEIAGGLRWYANSGSGR